LTLGFLGFFIVPSWLTHFYRVALLMTCRCLRPAQQQHGQLNPLCAVEEKQWPQVTVRWPTYDKLQSVTFLAKQKSLLTTSAIIHFPVSLRSTKKQRSQNIANI